MNNKQHFILYVKNLMKNNDTPMPDGAKLYWEALLGEKNSEVQFTQNGYMMMEFLQKHPEVPMWKAREIADGLGISSRAVAGAMRKLADDGYVERMGENPVMYSLTEDGKNVELKKNDEE